MALLGTLSVDSVNLRESLYPVAFSEKATETGLVVTKEDEGGGNDQGELQALEGVASAAEKTCGSHFGSAGRGLAMGSRGSAAKGLRGRGGWQFYSMVADF